MMQATEPEALLRIAEHLSTAGAEGFLLTGGSDASGKVPLSEFKDAISTIKETTSLKINAHVGLMPRPELEELVSSGVDAFSVDIIGSDAAIRSTMGLDARTEDFLSVVASLRDLGAKTIAPHVCVGIEGGELGGEAKAIETLAPFAPEAIVIIALVPTRGTPYEHVHPPSSESIIDVIRKAREAMPKSRLLLGCMRPRMEREWESTAVRAGVNGIAMPSRGTVRRLAQEGWNIVEKRRCCAIE